MFDHVSEELLAVAAAVLPGQDLRSAALASGGSHHVLLFPGVAVVRIARNSTAVAALPRRTELLRRLAGTDLPFAVPVPLSEVVRAEGHTAVALSLRGHAFSGQASDRLFHAVIRNFSNSAWTSRGGR